METDHIVTASHEYIIQSKLGEGKFAKYFTFE